MGSRCVICNVSIFNSKKANVCDVCLDKTIERYKKIIRKFYYFLDPKSKFYAETHNSLGRLFGALFGDSAKREEKEAKLQEFYNRINNKEYWYRKTSSSNKIILDEDFILGVGNKKFDTFPFIKEFIDDIKFENLLKEWNEFLTVTEPLPMGVKYYECEKCGVLMAENGNDIILHNESYYCKNCLQRAIDAHQTLLLNFLKFSDSKLKINNIEKIKLYYLDYKNCVEAFLKTPLFDIKSNVVEKDNSTNYDFLKFFVIKYIPSDAFTPLWNSFIKTGLCGGVAEGFNVDKACNRCHGAVYCNSDNDYDDYVRVKRDSYIICHRCEQWIKILGDLSGKYGWNPKWQQVLRDFEKYGIDIECEADPEVLYKILINYDIVMTEDFKNFWNSIYDKYNGDGIIRLYAIPEGTSGKIQQNAGRAIGHVSRFFGFRL